MTAPSRGKNRTGLTLPACFPARGCRLMTDHPFIAQRAGSPRVCSRRRGATAAPPGAIYVGRPTAFGNPFELGRDGDRDEVVERYRRWLAEPEQHALRERA